MALASGTLQSKTFTDSTQLKTTYIYKLNLPVYSKHIGIFVSIFHTLIDNDNENLLYYTTSNSNLLSSTISITNEIFKLYETILGYPYPYNTYKIIFMNDTYCNCMSFAGITIFNVNYLYDLSIIDQVYKTRISIANNIASSWLTNINIENVSDSWIIHGLISYLTAVYIEKEFGHNEIIYQQYMNSIYVCEEDTDQIIYDKKDEISPPALRYHEYK
jgi:hypothetical protein